MGLTHSCRAARSQESKPRPPRQHVQVSAAFNLQLLGNYAVMKAFCTYFFNGFWTFSAAGNKLPLLPPCDPEDSEMSHLFTSYSNASQHQQRLITCVDKKQEAAISSVLSGHITCVFLLDV